MLLRRHNLNLTPILRELLRTRSVARTAETVGLSHSAVSAALARLRETYNDPLLVMVGRRLELTEKGHQLIEPTERACLELEALLRPPEFDPSSEARRFVVMAADYITFLLAPPSARALAAQAPHAGAHFLEYAGDMVGQLARGVVDLIALPESTSGGLNAQYSAPWFSDDIVVIAPSENRPFEGRLTREAYVGARHAAFQLADRDARSHEARLLHAAGISTSNLILVDDFLTLPAIVEGSGCLALVQRRLAERFRRSHAIEIHEPPFRTQPVQIRAYWAPSADRDPAHRWFRELLAQIASDL